MVETEKFTPSWLGDTEIQELVGLLGKKNCRFVGGAVRDSILGLDAGDIDVATPLPPQVVATRLGKQDIKIIPTGLKHGTLTAVIRGRHFEITTLRHDVETFGRHARVAFHDDWEADAARRDFTINALYLSPEGTLYDYYAGRPDLKAGHIRFIGEADERIKEDALRILRFFRFYAYYGKGDLDSDGLAACAKAKNMLALLSPERVATEIKKLLAAQDPIRTIEIMSETGITEAALGGSPSQAAFRRLVAKERALQKCAVERRLASLVGGNAKSVRELARRLRLSNKETSRLVAIAKRDSGIRPGLGELELKTALYRCGAEAVEDSLILNADIRDLEQLRDDVEKIHQLRVPEFPLKGADIMSMGFEEGPKIGQRLKELERKWIESGFELSRDELLSRTVPE